MVDSKPLLLDWNESFPHLPSAPVVEAVIHWLARPETTLTPEKYRQDIADLLADYPECQPQRELRLEAKVDADGTSSRQQESWRGYRFQSVDRLHVAQFHRDGFVFSRLHPYNTWDQFSEEALRLWRLFVTVARPVEIQRLGVRFINRIPMASMADVRRVLHHPPKGIDQIGLPTSGFFQRSSHLVPGEPFQVDVVLATQPAAPGESEAAALILDLDAFTSRPFPVEESSVRERLQKMRWLKDKAFFSLTRFQSLKRFLKVQE